MATNTGTGSRKGAVKDRTQLETASGNAAKRDTATGKIVDVKTSDKKPLKGVAKEPDGRRKSAKSKS